MSFTEISAFGMPASGLPDIGSVSTTTSENSIYSDESFASLYHDLPEARYIADVHGAAACDAYVAGLMDQRETAAKRSASRAEKRTEILESIEGRSRLRKLIARLKNACAEYYTDSDS